MLEPGPGLARLEQLQRSAVNPREITPEKLEQLKHTLRGNPRLLRARPLICTLEGEILAGNQRHLALEELAHAGELGQVEREFPDGRYPVFAGEFDANERREIMLLDNQPFGRWVDDKLAELVSAHEQAGGDLAMLGFADTELRSLLRIAGGAGSGLGVTGDPDAEPPTPRADPIARPGDLYRLGDHALYVGDATSADDVAALFGPGDCRLVVTDPPYGVRYIGRVGAWRAGQSKDEVNAYDERRRRDGLRITGDSLTPEETRDVFAGALAAAPLREGGVFYATVPAGPMERWFLEAVEIGLPGKPPALRQGLVWIKDRIVMGRMDYHYRHELILYGWKPGAAHHIVDDRTLETVWEIVGPKVSKHHPTMKPTDLYRRAIRNSSEPGWTVYDPFGGSGTLVVACEMEGRVARTMEIDPAYADVIVGRWEELTGRVARLERDGQDVNLAELRLAAGESAPLEPAAV